MDWRHHAACRDEDPELFFPIGTSGPALLQVEQAKAVCRRCSVTDACLQWALESGQVSVAALMQCPSHHTPMLTPAESQ